MYFNNLKPIIEDLSFEQKQTVCKNYIYIFKLFFKMCQLIIFRIAENKIPSNLQRSMVKL